MKKEISQQFALKFFESMFYDLVFAKPIKDGRFKDVANKKFSFINIDVIYMSFRVFFRFKGWNYYF